MKCCIQNCAQNERIKKLNQSSTSSSTKITFHLFPKDPKQRATWVESLAIPNWMPTNRTMICSEHFKEEDFYVTKLGIRRVKHGVVPVIKDDFYGPAASRICKLCLSLDGKMYQLKDHKLDKMYQDIMGMVPRTDVNNRLPMGICWECAARLQSAVSFRTKALISDTLLQVHLKTNTDLKVIDILNLHRDHKLLKSSLLVQEVFNFNSLNLDEHAPNTLLKTEVIGIPHNEEVEIEVNNLITDKITITDEGKNEVIEETYLNNDLDVKTEIDLMPITENVIGESDFEFENDNEDIITDVHVKTNDSTVSKTDFDNIIMEGVVFDDRTNMLSKPLDCGDQIDDNDVNTKVSNEAVVRIEEVKITDVKRKKDAVKRKAKTGEDDAGPKRVRQRKRQSNVKPHNPLNMFTVKTLNHEYLIEEILERKDSDRYKQAPFKCTVCYKGFKTKYKQTRHALKHSEQNGPMMCVICKVRTKLGRAMGEHMKQLHSMEFTCKLCPFVTRSRGVALGHVTFHAGSKYQCPHCPAEFQKKTTYMSHLRLKHMSAYVCELCGYTFVNKNGVQIHKRRTHKFHDVNQELKGPFCEVCELKFLNQEAYDKHLRLSSKHIKETDPYRLSNDPNIKSLRLNTTPIQPVSRPMTRQRNVNVLAEHNGPVTCEQCDVKLENLRTYAAHFKSSHPGINRKQFTSTYLTLPYMCEHCGKMFLNNTTLTAHMSLHTGQKAFQCDHCNKTFTMKATLIEHIKQHEPVRRSYKCRECGKLFAYHNNLNRHMFIHTGLKPFKCNACEKAFRTSGEFQSHVDHIHLNKPWPKRVRRRVKKCDLPSIE